MKAELQSNDINNLTEILKTKFNIILLGIMSLYIDHKTEAVDQITLIVLKETDECTPW